MITVGRIDQGAKINIATTSVNPMLVRPDGNTYAQTVHVRPKGAGEFQDAAYVHNVTDGQSAAPYWSVYADKNDTAPMLTVGRDSSDGTTAVYRVLDTSGAALARITRSQGALWRFRRTRWTVEVAGGPTLKAAKGTFVGWCWWWLFSPIWLVMLVGVPFGGEPWRLPVKTVWRQGRSKQLVLTSIEKGRNEYVARADWPDARVLYALAALQFSHPAWRDR
ncbi:hypothetical protein [Yinghuangia seranimata]|uniref:hypothetical protein n=1 Tax=Yinghuangia seranimata TaxID=408067 RepID=UPI00248AE3E3|nr:hypothetical protein [Yinghuangia seranimata]MDI2130885.1 hypothetical protein [Yinghuangia seranimata]